ncbi:CHAP domain-containing protein [Candidatus Saccharibacteria bacterium]|nr:CHAP domain-containing protein [Candidatus Saccharibacteria bacterium]
MDTFRVLIKCVSIFITTAVMVLSGIASAPVFAADNGGYPWSDAVLLNSNTYDWGYPQCPDLVLKAQNCNAHISQYHGVNYYQSDPWRYDVRNCTSYVAWRVNQEFNINIGGWGNASQWGVAATNAGYLVDNSPRVGDVAFWHGYYGHVAFVTQVNGDGSVNVDQYNKAGTGVFSQESRIWANGYIHLAPAASAVNEPEPQEVIASTEIMVPQKPTEAVLSTGSLPSLSTDVSSIFNSTEDIDYEFGLSKDGVVIYEIKYDNTLTGKVELSVSDINNKNSSWAQTWAIDEINHPANLATYRIADYDADGSLDLYQIRFSNNSSNSTEVRVFDGSKQYKQLIGTWNTGQPTHDPKQANYQVADYNGDGSLDIFKVQKPTDQDKQLVTVLDGAQNFKQSIGSWRSDVPLPDSGRVQLGDDDRDGKTDIYYISHSDTGEIVSMVLSTESNYAQIDRTIILSTKELPVVEEDSPTIADQPADD